MEKLDQTNGFGEQQDSSNGTGQPDRVRADATYPLLIDREQAIASEHFGVLRSRILNLQAKSGMRSVIITSAQKGEGKSLVSLNLALSLAQLERQRILLVDGDLRVKGISELLGIVQEPGLSDFLRGQATVESCIRTTTLPYLWVTGAGTQEEEHLPTILEGPKWPEFLERAKESADLIIVDSVPVAAPIADFGLLSAACDGTLLIVHLRKTAREALALTMQQVNSKLLGVVINNQEPRIGFDYYSYYSGKKK
jgi:capsular exopolysaccharide synthesis family protein